MAVATLTSKGQVTIPASIRRIYGLDAGARLDFTPVSADTFIVRTGLPSLADLYGSLSGTGVRLTVDDMDEAIGQAVAEATR